MVHISIGELGHHWFWWWLVTCLVTSHYLNHCWLVNINCTFTDTFQGNLNQKPISSGKLIWKYCLQNGDHFIQASICWPLCWIPIHHCNLYINNRNLNTSRQLKISIRIITSDTIKKYHKGFRSMYIWYHISSFVQDCSNSSALAMELLQFCTKLSIHCEAHIRSYQSIKPVNRILIFNRATAEIKRLPLWLLYHHCQYWRLSRDLFYYTESQDPQTGID